MRESKKFQERSISEHNKKIVNYFLFFEGQKTEVIYFNSLKRNALKIGLNSLIELRPMMRSCKEHRCSNPAKIIDLVVQYIEELKSEKKSYCFIINTIIDYLVECEIISFKKANEWFNKLKQYCVEKNFCEQDNVTLKPSNQETFCEEVLNFIFNELKISRIDDDVNIILDALNIKYNASRDKVCIIVDRDKDSFVINKRVNQYDYVINTCKEKKYNLYITNPCFEFWLFLHLNDAKNISCEKWLENKKDEEKCTYAEIELRNICPSYTKSSYCAKEFINKIDNAVENEKFYCEDIIQLKNSLGSNIGLLITELRDNPNDT